MSDGKESVECRRCGKCCLANGLSLIKEDDLLRWRKEGRGDILLIVEKARFVWAGGRLVSSESGRVLAVCPFLDREGVVFFCSIYDTRPDICRDFVPGSSLICPLYE